jgi:transcriptional regulator with XRE-family HTH domain
MIYPEQMRAARALLGLNQTQLAKLAGVGIATVKRIEAESGQIRGAAQTIWKIQTALENAGVRFIDADENAGVGLRLKASRLRLDSSNSF